MQSQNRLFDDLAKMATSAMGVAAGMREEIEMRLRDQFERIVGQMDLVSREEFEAVKAVAARAREEQEQLAERVERLEAKLAQAELKPSDETKTKPSEKRVRAAKRSKKAAPKSD